jgi:hypothetical protein
MGRSGSLLPALQRRSARPSSPTALLSCPEHHTFWICISFRVQLHRTVPPGHAPGSRCDQQELCIVACVEVVCVVLVDEDLSPRFERQAVQLRAQAAATLVPAVGAAQPPQELGLSLLNVPCRVNTAALNRTCVVCNGGSVSAPRSLVSASAKPSRVTRGVSGAREHVHERVRYKLNDTARITRSAAALTER